MDLDLRLVRYFVAVAEELHFGRAARRLHVSQPALSRQVRRLEAQLGAALLVRDSRHVALTPRGQQLLDTGRELLRLSADVQRPPDDRRVRIAHVFELATSRDVAEAYARVRPDVQLVQHAMDSNTQFRALLEGRIDVAILRVTPQMRAGRPTGWSSTLLRLEPLRLVGRSGEPPRPTASLFARPLEVLGDAPESGLYNAHGDYLSAFERHTGLTMTWLGTPGAFGLCVAALLRATSPAYVLEFDSYAVRYAAAGLPVHTPLELQPHYPWSLAWRDGPLTRATADLLEVALETAARSGWQTFQGSPQPWLPADDPVAARLGLSPAPRSDSVAGASANER